MIVRTTALLLITTLAVSSLARAVVPHSVDYVAEVSPTPLIAATDEQALERKLAAFEKVMGIRVLLQLHTLSPSAEEDKVPGAYMHGLAQTLDVDQRGVLVVYFADEDDWRIWFGDEIAPHFVGQPRTTKELTESGAIHDAKEALLTASRVEGDSAFAKIQRTSGLPPEMLKRKRVRAHADALLDLMISKIVPE